MSLDMTKLKEKFDKKSGERTDRLNLKEKENYLRLLPPSVEYFGENIDYIAYEYLIHFNVGVEGSITAEVCPKSLGKHHRCPICEAVFKLYKTNTIEDKELANKLRAKIRYLFNVIDLSALERGIQVLEVGPKIYEHIVTFLTNPKWGDLLDLDKGRNFTITKIPSNETSSGYVEYNVTPDPDVTSVREKLPKNYKETISVLKKQVPIPKSYDDLKTILEGNDTESSKVAVVEEKDTKSEKITEEKDTKSEKITEEKEQIKENSTKKLDCFGEDFGPRNDKCLKCNTRDECRKKFLEL